MEDITASRKTVLQIKTKADDDNGGKTTTTIKGGRSTSKNRSIKYVWPALRSYYPVHAAGQRGMRRLRRTIRTGIIPTRP